mgnify:FL=1
MTLCTRPLLAALAVGCTALTAACTSGPLARGDAAARYFQYVSPDDRVVAEYLTPDAATCRQHLSNMERVNRHGADATRCSGTSASARLPVTAAARDGKTGADYAFSFNNMDQCTRMMRAVAESATVTRPCQ